MAEGQTVLVKGHAYGDLAAVVAFLFVLPVARFGISVTKAFKVSVGHVVEDHAALEGEEITLAVTQPGLDRFTVGEEFVAGVVDSWSTVILINTRSCENYKVLFLNKLHNICLGLNQM